ncbi:hypothetical protein [Parabacteroides sp.]
MRLFYFISYFLLSVCISSCRQDFVDGKTYTSTIVNHLGDESYIHALKIKNGYSFFLDDKNDSILRIYRNEQLRCPVGYLLKGTGEKDLKKPSFCKEIAEVPYKGIRVLDNDSYLKSIDPDTDSLISSVRIINGLWNNTDYNFISDEICALPFSPHKNYPFFFYNETNGYYWVDPDKDVAKSLQRKPVAYSACLVLNEKKKRIVVAYRYTNHISFYNLDGIVEKTFFTDKKIVVPVAVHDGIDIEATRKCFIETYGTEKYVYCLYDGSTDFSNNSRLYIYTWDGKSQGTISLDRNIRTFAVSEDDSFIIAISRSKQGGQDILKYRM